MLAFEVVTWVGFGILLALFRFFLPRSLAMETQARVVIYAVLAAVAGGFLGRALAPGATLGGYHWVGLLVSMGFAMAAVSFGCYRRCGTGIDRPGAAPSRT